ncbi:MAG: TonB family protein [Xanthomonadales bacterium]|nr:TonB family protein [Xanthomonadales bacterium]
MSGILTMLAGEALEAVLATSAACLLVLLLRGPARALFGARAAYALWWLVPAALLAVLLPAPQIAPTAIELGRASAAFGPLAQLAAPESPELPAWTRVGLALTLVWLIGCVAALIALVRQQRRFRRSLGSLQPAGEGLWKAEAREGLPAVIGLHPRIVLPADFERRYTPEQQTLVLAHERVHAARGDVYWNLGIALLCALQWFNPLIRMAQRAFRLDQELACDARVLALHPQSRRSYGEALLGSSTAFPAAPLACAAFGTHPLKERITMLTRPLPSLIRVSAGFALSLALGTGVAGLAWAQQTPRIVDAEMLDIQLQLSIDGGPTHSPRVITPAGQEFGIRLEAPEGQEWSFDLVAERAQQGLIDVSGRVSREGTLAASPQLSLREGVPGRIALEGPDAGRFSLLLTAKATTGAAPPPPPAPPAPPASPAAVSASAPPAPPAPPTPPSPPAPRPAPIVAVEPPQGDDTAVAYRRLQPAKYPKEAIAQKIEGETLLHVQVLSSGAPGQISVYRSSGSELLDQAAIDTTSNWLFHPAKRAGKAIEAWITVPIRFALDEEQLAASEAEAVGTPPSYRRLSPPDYPATAKAAGQEGTTLLEVEIDATGNVQTVNIVAGAGSDVLDRAASDAVERWSFNPATSDGLAVDSRILVPVQFIASNSAAEPYAAPPGALDTITLRAD